MAAPETLSPADAADRLHTVDSLGIPLATGQPPAFLAALGERDDWEQLRVGGALLLVGTELFDHEGVHYLSGFFGPIERGLRSAGANLGFAPAGFRQFATILRQQQPRVMCTVAAPPDADGWCSLSLHAGGTFDELQRAGTDPDRVLVVEVSGAYPRTRGLDDTHRHALHLDEIDLLVESEAEPFPLTMPDPDETTQAIAENAAAFISEGATVQTGIGAIPSAIIQALAEGEGGDYGVHSELFTDGLMRLHKAGKVTNRKGQYDGISVTTFAAGSPDLYGWLDANPEVAFAPVEIVNSPDVIAANRSMVSINGAVSIDIHGQVVADTINGEQHSGIGGHEDFMAGTALSLEQRSLLCLPSTATVDDETISRIVPYFDAGAIVTTPRHQVDVVVTEHGSAELRGRTSHERGKALAEIAHPDFRDELREAAERASGGNSAVAGEDA